MLHAVTEESGMNRTIHNQHVESMVSSLFEWQTTFTFDEFRMKVLSTFIFFHSLLTYEHHLPLPLNSNFVLVSYPPTVSVLLYCS